MTATAPQPPRVLSVSQLTALIQGSLESTFASVWVSGEVSEISRPQSGHVYFTLKDEGAQLRGVLWRSSAVRLRFRLEEGQQVLCLGDLTVYPPRGAYQLDVRRVEPQGQGALQLAFQQLQRRLAAEGLFDPARKRPLPVLPRRVGIVTSPSGAAIHDFLQVAARRCCGVRIFVIPARVQGDGASGEIVHGIQLANRLHPPLDVLVVGRGGGSLEDLWSFNEEAVVRAIHASRVPVVSAVGHEVDVTLADLAADVRALTPSEAAERVFPAAEELTQRLTAIQRRLIAILRARASAARRHLEQLARSRILRNPKSLVFDLSRRLDEHDQQALRAIARRLDLARDRLTASTARLESLSPLAVLARGYSVTTDDAGKILKSTAALRAGDTVHTRLATGGFTSRVGAVESE
ncbi:MAG TPA: exodeoxyribonuclease VII large subunit [Pirellulaceae bacterium]|nr:exodeoxyribonuclease VII large subunit [Pirellulaceae bacterium]